MDQAARKLDRITLTPPQPLQPPPQPPLLRKPRPSAEPNARPISITRPPRVLALDPYYAKYLEAYGLPIIAAIDVEDEALYRARRIVLRVLGHRPDIRRALLARGYRVAVVPYNASVVELPELKKTHLDVAGRSLSVADKALICVAEENLMRRPRWEDAHHGESLLLKELAATVMYTLAFTDPTFRRRLHAAYVRARELRLFELTPAVASLESYWEEGVQLWFDLTLENTRADYLPSQVRARNELRAYDSRLTTLLEEICGE